MVLLMERDASGCQCDSGGSSRVRTVVRGAPDLRLAGEGERQRGEVCLLVGLPSLLSA